MKMSELIAKLATAITAVGDVDVTFVDGDRYDWEIEGVIYGKGYGDGWATISTDAS